MRASCHKLFPPGRGLALLSGGVVSLSPDWAWQSLETGRLTNFCDPGGASGRNSLDFESRFLDRILFAFIDAKERWHSGGNFQ